VLAELDGGDVLFVHGRTDNEGLGRDVGELYDVAVDFDAGALGNGLVEDDAVDGAAEGLAVEHFLGGAGDGLGGFNVLLEFAELGGALGL